VFFVVVRGILIFGDLCGHGSQRCCDPTRRVLHEGWLGEGLEEALLGVSGVGGGPTR
jgi:hypothetical protein